MSVGSASILTEPANTLTSFVSVYAHLTGTYWFGRWHCPHKECLIIGVELEGVD